MGDDPNHTTARKPGLLLINHSILSAFTVHISEDVRVFGYLCTVYICIKSPCERLARATCKYVCMYMYVYPAPWISMMKYDI